jgi:hypothetical protein
VGVQVESIDDREAQGFHFLLWGEPGGVGFFGVGCLLLCRGSGWGSTVVPLRRTRDDAGGTEMMQAVPR